MSSTKRLLAALLTALAPAACDGDSGETAGPMGNVPPGAARCTMPRQVSCVDEATAALRLHTAANPTMVTTTALGGGVFESRVDATGGGLATPLSYVYVRFDQDGLQKVQVGDEAAFQSMEWDLAFRRYIVRINGGSSGPSCADVALADRPFESLTGVPASLSYETDQFLVAPACTVTADEQLGAPQTAIFDYYSYDECLKMNGRAFVIRLGDGRNVAMEILGYYPDNVQATCNETGKLPGGTTGGGNFRLRWKFLSAS